MSKLVFRTAALLPRDFRASLVCLCFCAGPGGPFFRCAPLALEPSTSLPRTWWEALAMLAGRFGTLSRVDGFYDPRLQAAGRREERGLSSPATRLSSLAGAQLSELTHLKVASRLPHRAPTQPWQNCRKPAGKPRAAKIYP